MHDDTSLPAAPENSDHEVPDMARLAERARAMGMHPQVFGLVFAGLQRAAAALDEPGHVTAAQIALAVRAEALDNFGLLGREVLAHWGMRSTEDIGRVVEVLCDEKVLRMAEDDRIEDFADVYSFEEFDRDYEIGRSTHQRLR